MTKLRPSEGCGKSGGGPIFGQNPKFWPHFSRYLLQICFVLDLLSKNEWQTNFEVNHTILTCFFETNRMVIRTKLYLPWFSFWFLDPIFAPRPHMGSNARMGLKPPASCVYVPSPSPPTYIPKLVFQKYYLP